MTIKEAETCTGMERATIRFYEREGFITPRRMENGYRDYAEDDVQMLLRVKLLRSLHIPLDAIKTLQKGDLALEDVLSRQIVKLDREKQDAIFAQDVCRAMRDDKVTFAHLDAQPYLEGIRSVAAETGSVYFAAAEDAIPQAFHPWRRYLARGFDVFLYRLVWLLLLAILFRVNPQTRSAGGNLLDSLTALVIMLYAEPLWLRLLGTTPGKAIFGLSIETPEGKRLSYKEGRLRTWRILGAGMGYGFPIYEEIRLWKSYQLCRDKEPQPWDVSVSYTIKDTKAFRGAVFVAASAGLVFAFAMSMGAIRFQQMLPPNRGPLTVAEFAENYNFYADRMGIDIGKTVNANGRWVDKQTPNVTYIDRPFSQHIPDFAFRTENGIVTEVSFTVEAWNNEHWIPPYDNHILLISTALLYAQEEINLFSQAPTKVGNQVFASSFQNFHFSEMGLVFSCEIEQSGYYPAEAMQGSYFSLIPNREAEENYFRMHFSLRIE